MKKMYQHDRHRIAANMLDLLNGTRKEDADAIIAMVSDSVNRCSVVNGSCMEDDFVALKKTIRDKEVIRLHESGLGQKEIADKLNLSQPTVSRIISGVTVR